MVEIKEPSIFFEIQAKFTHISYSQSEGWFNYVKAQGKKVAFFLDQDPDTSIMCWGIVEKVPLIGKKILRIEGDVHSEVSEKVIRTFYLGIKELDYLGIEIDNNSPYSDAFEIGIRRAGFLRPIGSFSCPLAIEVDLSTDLNISKGWRRNLKKTNDYNMNFKEIEFPTTGSINSFVALFNEMTRSKKLSFNLSLKPISKLINSDDFRFFMVYDKKDTPISALIVYLNNYRAEPIFVANSILSKKYGGPFFMYKELLELLKSEQIKIFNHGRIPPSDTDSNGVYLFKRGTGGNKVHYNGEWTYYKSRLAELAVFFYKWFKLKKQRY